jgi:hypothetical protein
VGGRGLEHVHTTSKNSTRGWKHGYYGVALRLRCRYVPCWTEGRELDWLERERELDGDTVVLLSIKYSTAAVKDGPER